MSYEFINGNQIALIPKEFSFNADENYYRKLKSVLTIKRAKDLPFVRVGKANDGGYIMVDKFNTGGGQATAYSFGISDDISWDADMAKRGYDVFMYDMTIDKLPYENEKFHFFKEGIGGVKDETKLLDTLENFIARNGHENNSNMILKMDVEGAEWNFLETVSSETLNKFDQMTFEFHGMIAPKTADEMARTINLIDKINATHTLVHVHGNNSGYYIQVDNVGNIPSLLELTYLRNENHTFYDDEAILLPIAFDNPNHPALVDIPLGYWNKFKRV